MWKGLIFGCVVGVRIHYPEYVLNCISGWGRQDEASPQTSQHFGAVEVHDPVGVCAVFFREFGFSPFGDEVGQNLRLDSSSWLVGYVEWEELNGPFGNPSRSIAVVDNIIKWHFRGYCNRTLLKVVLQLPGCHEYRISYLLIMWVP